MPDGDVHIMKARKEFSFCSRINFHTDAANFRLGATLVRLFLNGLLFYLAPADHVGLMDESENAKRNIKQKISRAVISFAKVGEKVGGMLN